MIASGLAFLERNDPGGPGNPRRRLARRAGGVLAGLLVAAFLVWGVKGGWSHAASYPWTIDWPILAAAVATLVAFYAAWVVGYVGLVETLAASTGPRARMASIWARSLLGRYVPGNVLMVAARVVLGREAGVPARVSVTASLYEQVAMVAAAALAAAGFLLTETGSWSPLFWLVLVVPFSVVLLDPKIVEGVLERILRRFGRSGTVITLTRRQLAVVLLWFGLTMALMGAGTALGVRAVAGARAGALLTVGLGFLLAWSVSMVAFIFPSGLGIREGAFALVLSRHLSTSAAISLAAASRLLMTAVELAVIATLIAVGRRRPHRRGAWPGRPATGTATASGPARARRTRP